MFDEGFNEFVCEYAEPFEPTFDRCFVDQERDVCAYICTSSSALFDEEQIDQACKYQEEVGPGTFFYQYC